MAKDQKCSVPWREQCPVRKELQDVTMSKKKKKMGLVVLTFIPSQTLCSSGIQAAAVLGTVYDKAQSLHLGGDCSTPKLPPNVP